MALVIETGVGSSSSTSYVTVAEARAYALARGVTLSSTDSVVEVQILKAMDFLQALTQSYQGCKTWPPALGQYDHEQALAWPRTGVVIDGYSLNSDKIPQTLKDAQCQLVIEIFNGVDIMPTGTGAAIKREKVDVLETEYANAYTNASSPTLTKVYALLKPIMGYGYGSAYIFRS